MAFAEIYAHAADITHMEQIFRSRNLSNKSVTDADTLLWYCCLLYSFIVFYQCLYYTMFIPLSDVMTNVLLFYRRLHQQFESYKEQISKIGEDPRRYPGEHKDDAPTCGICHKTKFADGCGHLCSYCRTKFCARCGGRVSLRSNNVSLLYLRHTYFT